MDFSCMGSAQYTYHYIFCNDRRYSAGIHACDNKGGYDKNGSQKKA